MDNDKALKIFGISQSFFSFVSLYGFDISYKILDWLACMSALETGYWSSDIYLENHNLFGMKVPHVRINCVVRSNRGHAVYCSDIASFLDLLLWFSSHFGSVVFSDLETFVNSFSKSSYNPSNSYCDKVNSIYNQYSKYRIKFLQND